MYHFYNAGPIFLKKEENFTWCVSFFREYILFCSARYDAASTGNESVVVNMDKSSSLGVIDMYFVALRKSTATSLK